MQPFHESSARCIPTISNYFRKQLKLVSKFFFVLYSHEIIHKWRESPMNRFLILDWITFCVRPTVTYILSINPLHTYTSADVLMLWPAAQRKNGFTEFIINMHVVVRMQCVWAVYRATPTETDTTQNSCLGTCVNSSLSPDTSANALNACWHAWMATY